MLNATTLLFKWSLYRGGHFIEVVTNEILCYHSNVCMKRCIQNNIFMLKADYMNIIVFGGLGCTWCHLSIGKCVQNFVQKNVVSP